METTTDEELIRASREGSEAAFRELVERHYQQAYSMAVYWTHNREVALDISQESFIRVFRHLKNFDPTRSFRAWLYTIVKNLSFNYIRRQGKRRLVFSDFFATRKGAREPEADRDDHTEKRELKEWVWRALQKLNDKDRDIILLKDFEDFSYREISEALNIPMGTVMSRLYHARKKLGNMLGDAHGEK